MMRFSFSGRGSPIFIIGFGGLFILIAIVITILLANSFFQLQHYQAGQCTITAKQLLQEEQQETTTSNGHTYRTTKIVYSPNFHFTVQTATGRNYQAQGYDSLGTSFDDRSSGQAVVDQYIVGKSYSCWYYPSDPTQAVLNRQFDMFIFFIPGLFFFIGAIFVVVGIVMRRGI